MQSVEIKHNEVSCLYYHNNLYTYELDEAHYQEALDLLVDAFTNLNDLGVCLQQRFPETTIQQHREYYESYLKLYKEHGNVYMQLTKEGSLVSITAFLKPGIFKNSIQFSSEYYEVRKALKEALFSKLKVDLYHIQKNAFYYGHGAIYSKYKSQFNYKEQIERLRQYIQEEYGYEMSWANINTNQLLRTLTDEGWKVLASVDLKTFEYKGEQILRNIRTRKGDENPMSHLLIYDPYDRIGYHKL